MVKESITAIKVRKQREVLYINISVIHTHIASFGKDVAHMLPKVQIKL